MDKPLVSKDKQEIIIKSKRRVQKHGEVFTPKWMVEKMLNTSGVKEACNIVTATFLEPAAGEGTFLIEILKNKLKMVSKKNCTSITEYENYSLLALSSLYGIELLEDNAHICIMNIFNTYLDFYTEVSKRMEKPINNKVLASAKVIISNNIRQGNFLTRFASNGESIRFSEWRVANDISRKPKVIEVDPTEYTLEEIYIKQEKELGDMRFDVIIGNPPYQNEGIGDMARDEPIYHKFMEESYEIADRVSFITPARFLFNAGQTPKSWNQRMLNDKHLKVEYYEPDSSKVFPNTDIKGGVAITYRDTTKDFGKIDTFIPYNELIVIIEKVVNINFRSINEILYGRSSYKLSPRLYVDHPELRGRVKSREEKSVGSNIFMKLPEVFKEVRKDENQIMVLGRANNSRAQRWICRDFIQDHPNLIKYKVLLPKSNGTGAMGEKLSSPIVASPNSAHTQTYISFGAFDDEELALNLQKYIKTKFLRILLGSMKITQDNATKEVWKHVPLQDFSSASDINWTKSINEIDKQLYKKYSLNHNEITFIEMNGKSME